MMGLMRWLLRWRRPARRRAMRPLHQAYRWRPSATTVLALHLDDATPRHRMKR